MEGETLVLELKRRHDRAVLENCVVPLMALPILRKNKPQGSRSARSLWRTSCIAFSFPKIAGW